MLLAAPVFGQVEEAREAQNRGVELQRQGELQGARREFDRVIELVPQSPFGWYNRGLVRRELKDCGGALADFDRAIELDAKFFNALYQRGNCRQALGEYEQALDDYTRALALPGQIRGRFAAYYARGDALRRLARIDEAYADYSRVLELRVDTAALRSRAWVAFYLGRWRDAFRDIAKYLHDTDAREADAPYAVLLGMLALERLHEKSAAFAADAERLETKGWPAPVLRYFRGEIDQARLLSAAQGAGERTEALAYAGAKLLGAGEGERGVALLRRALREGEPGYLEYDLAYHELRRLGLAGAAERRERKPNP